MNALQVASLLAATLTTGALYVSGRSSVQP
jgi:hypothetical protein